MSVTVQPGTSEATHGKDMPINFNNLYKRNGLQPKNEGLPVLAMASNPIAMASPEFFGSESTSF